MTTKLGILRACAAVIALVVSSALSSAFAGTVQYTYDPLGRLTAAAYDSGTTVTYTYDPAGNLLKKTTALATTPTTRTAIEFFHAAFGHYFVSSDAEEIDKLDTGFFTGWARTGQSFKVFVTGANAVDVCRFFTVTFAPKSSHFYTPIASECAKVKANPDWLYEKIAFKLVLPAGGVCPAATQILYRLYNSGQTGAPNHRYTISAQIRSEMIAKGFVPEDDNAACVPL
jgi:YD repeat-containing protein